MDAIHLEVAIDAALAGASELMKRRDSFSFREKGFKDLVTDADLASQQAIFARLAKAFPDEVMMGEEEGFDIAPTDSSGVPVDVPIWIVDPLDGTLNYVHQLQNFCVSIGLAFRNELQVGVVVDPVCDEMFTAIRGEGAWVSRLDGSGRKRIAVSKCEDLSSALLACSFPAGVKSDAIEVQQFCRVLEQCQALRRLGSCALNLCYVAAGRLDGYWAQSVKVWDMAAGALIVREAGGQINSIQGGPLDLWEPKFSSAATRPLQDELIKVLWS
jgi:myo-inositol-1(or 4)-monophosphatase